MQSLLVRILTTSDLKRKSFIEFNLNVKELLEYEFAYTKAWSSRFKTFCQTTNVRMVSIVTSAGHIVSAL